MTFPELDVPSEYSGPDGPVSIYALVDPRDMTVRYVGRTENVVAREATHRHQGTQPKMAWLHDLQREGLSSLLAVLDRCEVDEAAAKERSWVQRYAKRGDLYNVHLVREADPAQRRQTSALLLRMSPDDRRILESAADAAEAEMRKQQPTATLGLGPYLIGLGLKDAERRGVDKRKGGR